MRVKVKLTTNSPKIWKCWRSIGGDLDSSVERIARPCSRSAADCVGSLLPNALGRQFQSRGRNTRSLRMEGPLRIALCRLAKSVVAGIGGHLKWRVRSEPKQHDNPGAQPSHSTSFDHVRSPNYPLNHQHLLTCRTDGYRGISGSVSRGSVALLTPVADPYCPSGDPT
jgi:hypothetical protein